uniref:Uncharacterized protein n=1 Tax=viral metagenome TaxID=1070528 RepID=A0A6C0KBA9_9ZZZZ
MRQKNKLCYENDIRIKVYNKMNREVILPDQRTISRFYNGVFGFLSFTY